MDRSALPALLRSLWRHRYVIAIVTLAVAAIAYGVTNLQPGVYVAEAQMFLVDPRGAGLLGGGGQPRIDSEAFVNQQVQQATSRQVIERAVELAGGDLAAEQVAQSVVVEAQPDLLAMRVTATGRTPDQAASFANAVVDAYDAVVRERGLANAERAVAELAAEVVEIQQQIDDLARRLTADPDQPILNARLQSLVQLQLQLEARQRELTVEAVAAGSGIDLIERATPPSSAAGPKPLRDAIVFGLLSLLVTGGAAHWHASSRRKVEHRLDAERILEVPLLGEVPRFDPQAVDAGELDPVVAEAMQFVLSSLDFVIGGDAETISIALTSAIPREGKTSLSLLLALVIGREERSVVLVDADLRARGLTRRLQRDGQRGLTDFVDLRVPMQRCVHRSAPGSIEPITVMTAGRNPDPPAGMLRSQGFGRRLDELKRGYGIVILDTPPLLAVADAAVVCAQADAVVLIVDDGIRIAELERLRERLQIIPRPVLGYIYNRAPLRGSHYGYGYGPATNTPRTQSQDDTPHRARDGASAPLAVPEETDEALVRRREV